MYDPLIVDTFSRVYTNIVPSERPSTAPATLRAIAASANPTIEPHSSNVRLEDISASTDEMLTLFNLAKSLSPSMHIADIGDILTKHVRRLIPSSLSVFYLFDGNADDLVASHIVGEPAAMLTGLRIPRGQRLSGWVAANRQTIRNSDPVLDFGESARAMSPRPRSCLSTPLIDRNELVGVLSLYSTNRDAFTADHERVIEIVARQVAPVLRSASEFEHVRSVSLRDEMTGLPNLEHFSEFSRSAEESAHMSEAPASLLLIDLRGTKRVNSAWWATIGHSFLNKVADRIRRALRPTDILFFDKESQFIAVLLHTDDVTGAALARQLSEGLTAINDTVLHDYGLRLTVAVATAPRDGRTFQMMMATAKRRLADASGNGGLADQNRVH